MGDRTSMGYLSIGISIWDMGYGEWIWDIYGISILLSTISICDVLSLCSIPPLPGAGEVWQDPHTCEIAGPGFP
jgi:hypothetical protein